MPGPKPGALPLGHALSKQIDFTVKKTRLQLYSALDNKEVCQKSSDNRLKIN